VHRLRGLYVKLAARHKGEFPQNVTAPYIDIDLMDVLTHKERFYTLCDQYGIDHPGTFVYHKEMGHDFELPFPPPYICKPANGVCLLGAPLRGQREGLLPARPGGPGAHPGQGLRRGYPDTMILQEFIPGDDSYMRVLTCYSDDRPG
jgi:D-aspartate ligase